MSDDHINGGGWQSPSKAERLEHAEIDGVHGKKVFPINLPPTAQTNPSYVISKNISGYTVKIEETIGSTTYTTNIVPYDNDTVITQTKTISEWT